MKRDSIHRTDEPSTVVLCLDLCVCIEHYGLLEPKMLAPAKGLLAVS